MKGWAGKPAKDNEILHMSGLYDEDGIDGPWINAMVAPLPTRYDRLRKEHPRHVRLGEDAARAMWDKSGYSTRAQSAKSAMGATRVIGVDVPWGPEESAVAYRFAFKRTWGMLQNRSFKTRPPASIKAKSDAPATQESRPRPSKACEFEQSECDECTAGRPQNCHRMR